MDEASLSNIRAQLVARRSRLERVMSDFEATTQLVGLLREVDAALERVTDGTYGICVECESPIPKERLVIMPFARLCVNCQAEIERSKTIEKEFKEEREYRKLAFTSSDEEEA